MKTINNQKLSFIVGGNCSECACVLLKNAEQSQIIANLATELPVTPVTRFDMAMVLMGKNYAYAELGNKGDYGQCLSACEAYYRPANVLAGCYGSMTLLERMQRAALSPAVQSFIDQLF